MRSRALAVGLTLAAGVAACAPSRIVDDPGRVAARRPAADGTVEIVLLGTTDVHGRLLAWDYYAGEPAPRGLARVATLVDSIRVAQPQVVLVDSGDLLQGNPLDYVYGVLERADVHPVVRAMNRLGYDAAAIGNHEFNYGLDRLDAALEDAAFPFLAANAFVAGTDSLRWPAWTVVGRGGVRIGILGLTTPGSAIWDRDHVDGRLEFRDIVDSAERVWPAVEAASDLQVVAIHSGMGPGSSYDESATEVPEENAARRLAERLPGIDVVFLGHSHRDVPSETVNGVLFTQAGQWAEALAVATITLEREGGGWRVVAKRARTIPTADVPPDPGFEAELRPYHERTLAYVADTIGWTAEPWSSEVARLVDTPIIDLVQRVQLDATGADLSAASAFTTDATLGPGPITVADAARLYVYDNTLKTIRITGRQLRDYLERSAGFFHRVDASGELADPGAGDLAVDSIAGYNYDMVAGVDYAVDLTRPVGERIVDLVWRGAPVSDGQTFTLALNSYRQGGGGGFAMLRGAEVLDDGQREVRRLLVDWIAARDTLRQADVFEPSWRLLPEAVVARWWSNGVATRAGPRAPPGLAGLPPPLPAASDSVRIAVLATNDFHGALEPLTPSWAGGDTVGGAAVLAAFVRAVEERYPGATLHLDGGDIMQGTVISNLTGGRSTVEAFDALGVDGAAIGNHEFDWGVDTLRARIAEAGFPWLSANIVLKSTGARPEWVEPYAWIERAGLRIAVIGATTRSTPETTLPTNVEPYRFLDIAEVVDELAPRLRAEGADLVALVVHAGGFEGDDGRAAGEIVDAVERMTAPIDLVVSGHTHSRLETEVAGTPIVQANSSGTALGVVVLTFDRRRGQVVADTTDVWTTWHRDVDPDPTMADLVTRWRREVDAVASRPVARLATALFRARGQESALGDLIADAQRAMTGDEIAIVNGGGIRTDLQAGEVTYEDLFAVQPFQNGLVRARLDGGQLRRALEAVVDDRIGQVSGIRIRFDPRAPRGRRVVDATLEDDEVPVIRDGRVVDPDREFRVTVNSFMASGGSGYDVFTQVEGMNTGMTDIEALVEHLRGLPQPVRYEVQGRLEPVAPWPEPREP